MKNHYVLGVHITDRIHNVTTVQNIFTEYGCSIRTRLGLHEASENICSPNGLVVLEMVGDDAESKAMVSKLRALEGVEVQEMVFTHP
jgi:hypothetical protein